MYVTLDQAQTGPGGTFMMKMDSAMVRVYIKTKAVTDGVEKTDTTYVTLGSKVRSAEISHDYTGTSL